MILSGLSGTIQIEMSDLSGTNGAAVVCMRGIPVQVVAFNEDEDEKILIAPLGCSQVKTQDVNVVFWRGKANVKVLMLADKDNNASNGLYSLRTQPYSKEEALGVQSNITKMLNLRLGDEYSNLCFHQGLQCLDTYPVTAALYSTLSSMINGAYGLAEPLDLLSCKNGFVLCCRSNGKINIKTSKGVAHLAPLIFIKAEDRIRVLF